ncbi:PP2C family protein-serine/threonine phosphatase [Thalassococcus sp. S3]|uniref:PP2C family protein-serine/threonine phosphatase n=1 Tax=Thalassococcus sp. S3 TaxID=2017482 RepID=UPI0026B906CF
MTELEKQADEARQIVGASIRRVLVVDDSKLQRRILVSSLNRWGFEVLQAESGEAALEICAKTPPDLVLSDWMMPGMSGLEFCKTFRGLKHESYGYFILLTSKSDKGEIAEGLDAGADDFLTKPVNSDELRARISAGDRILRMQRELSEKNRVITKTLGKLQEVYDTIDKDLMQAKKIQESLVPNLSEQFGKSRVSLLLKPCGHIGGDLVGMFSPGPNRVGFYSIDVSGHGITSAMMTARLGSYLSSKHFDQNVAMELRLNKFFALRPPEEVAALLNNRLAADAGIEEYFTMVYGIADLRTGSVKLVQAGHPHPLLLRRDGTHEFIGSGGVPIGLLPDISYQQIELKMEVGDKLLLYSDGFTECEIGSGGMLEEDGLLRLISKAGPIKDGQEFLDDLFWRLTEEMSASQTMGDDVSATLFEYFGP